MGTPQSSSSPAGSASGAAGGGTAASFPCVHSFRTAAIRALLLIVAPMMPHIAEEAWQAMASGLVAEAQWPQVDPSLLVEDEVTIAVQVNALDA